jgi:hypothetical protein
LNLLRTGGGTSGTRFHRRAWWAQIFLKTTNDLMRDAANLGFGNPKLLLTDARTDWSANNPYILEMIPNDSTSTTAQMGTVSPFA